MKKIIATLFFLIPILVFSQDKNLINSSNQNNEYYKVSKVRIYVNDVQDIDWLRKLGLGIERVKLIDGHFDTFLDNSQKEILFNSGFQYNIIIEDVTKDYLERTKEFREEIKKSNNNLRKTSGLKGFDYGGMGGYYTFNEVIAQLDTMRAMYPNLITKKDSIGSSIEGRTIWAVKISDNPELDEDEPEIFYNSLIHAREPEGMMVVIYFMYYLLENYGSDPEVTYLVNNRELYFVPVINPDGYEYNRQISPNGGGMWRKNRRNNGGGSYGVDLNRNFGYEWGHDNWGSSPDPNNICYRGTESFSEPETQTIKKFCENHNFIISCNYHTFWDVIFPPWSYNMKQTSDSTIFNNLIGIASSLNGYRNGAFVLPPEGYPSNGDVLDWMYGETTEKNRIFGVLTEVGNEDEGFWPIPSKIKKLAQDNLYSNLVYAWGPGIINEVPYISNLYLSSTYFDRSSDTVNIFAVETNSNGYKNNISAELLSSNNNIIDTVQLTATDSIYTGEFVLNSLDEANYKIKLTQNGVDIPLKFYYNDLKFTTVGPIILNSYNVTRLDANTIYLHNLSFTNKSDSKVVPSVYINAQSSNEYVTLIDGKKSLGNLNPQSTKKMNGGFLFNIGESEIDSVNLIVEISSGSTKYWENNIKIEIPELLEPEDLVVKFYDEIFNINNWIAKGWNITNKQYVSPPFAFTDSPGGNYSSNTTSTLTSNDTFTLVNSIYSFLEFDGLWDIEYGWDYGMVQISYDKGASWTPLKGQYTNTGSGNFQPNGAPLYHGTQPNWVHEVINLADYSHKPFKLRFLLKSDQAENWDGWYIDNIKLSNYSAISADELSINKKSLKKDVDSVQFRIRYTNPYNHEFLSYLIYSNENKTVLDSLVLYDDGLHGDSLSSDNIYGNYIPPLANEDFYTIGISTKDYKLDNYIKTENLLKFTNAGPIRLVLDSLRIITISDNLIGLMNIGISNEGLTETVPFIKADISSQDTNIVSFNVSQAMFFNLNPGESKFVKNSYSFKVKNIPDSINFNLDISSNNEIYWTEPFTIHLTPVGVNSNIAKIPDKYELSQNYPNPFNPTTTIKYSIPEEVKSETLPTDRQESKVKNVMLKVYDILGREVATLVNQKQKPGNYEVNFDGSDLPSGIYYYVLNFGEKKFVKNMILLK